MSNSPDTCEAMAGQILALKRELRRLKARLASVTRERDKLACVYEEAKLVLAREHVGRKTWLLTMPMAALAGAIEIYEDERR